MIEIHLHGPLAKLVPDSALPLSLHVRSPAEAYLALRALLPAFETTIREGEFTYLVDDTEPVTQQTCDLLLPDGASLHIYPVAEGSGPILDFFLGVFSFIGDLFFPSLRNFDRDTPDERASYLFDGPVNTRAQGGVVPLVFGGPIRVGSYTISAGVSSARLLPPRTHLPRELKNSPAEFENTLQTGATIRIVDLISEGEIRGLVNGAQSVFLDGVPVQNREGEENIQRGAAAPPNFRGGFGNVGWGYLPITPASVPASNQNLKGVKIDSRNGTAEQTPLDGIPAIEAERIVGAQVTQSIAQVQRINGPDVDAARVTIGFPRLVEINDDGDRIATRVEFAVDVRAGGGDFEQVMRQEVNDKNNSPAEISYDIPLEGDAPFDIRVRRITPDSDSDNRHNRIEWSRLTEIKQVRQSYPHSAVVSIVAEAERFTGNIQRREYEVYGIIVDVPSNYDPETRAYEGLWDGAFKRAWTDNGAWIFYHMLTNRRFGLGGEIADEYLSATKWALYTIAQFNDGIVNYSINGGPDEFTDADFEFTQGRAEPRFRFTGVIQKAADAKKLLDNMLSNFHAALYYGGGAIVPVQDAPAEPEALITNANVIEGEFRPADMAWSERVSVVHVSFNDPDDDYKLGVEPVIDNDLIAKYGYKRREVVAMFCTSRGQAHRLGRLLLYEQEYESDVLPFRMGLDQMTLRPGAVFRQADRLVAGVRTGCRLAGYTGGAQDTLRLDDMGSLPAPDPARAWIANIVLSDGSVARHPVADYRPDEHTIVIGAHLDPAPADGAIVVLEREDVQARLWRLLEVKEIDGLEYEFTARAYLPDKYDAVERNINIVTPGYRLADTPDLTLPAPTRVTLTERQYMDANVARVGLSISVEGSSEPPIAFVEYQIKGPFAGDQGAGAVWEAAGQDTARDIDLPGIYRAGEYQARARFVAGDQRAVSPWTESAPIFIQGSRAAGRAAETIYRRARCRLGSQALAAGLEPGQHTFQVRAVSPAGPSPASNSLTITIEEPEEV